MTGAGEQRGLGVGPAHVAVLSARAAADQTWPGDDLAQRIDEWAKVADHAGIQWLTVRPFDGTCAEARPVVRRLGGCTVIVDSEPDGRKRLTDALGQLPAHPTENDVSAALNHPAPTDPDLIVVVGPDRRLPTSVVWELAYAEMVYIDAPGGELTGGHLEDAITEFAHRHRRFGGLD